MAEEEAGLGLACFAARTPSRRGGGKVLAEGAWLNRSVALSDARRAQGSARHRRPAVQSMSGVCAAARGRRKRAQVRQKLSSTWRICFFFLRPLMSVFLSL